MHPIGPLVRQSGIPPLPRQAAQPFPLVQILNDWQGGRHKVDGRSSNASPSRAQSAAKRTDSTKGRGSLK
eukprot:8333285-Heterocapsa_arctica.AAC.1